jgi:hypothetical protein
VGVGWSVGRGGKVGRGVGTDVELGVGVGVIIVTAGSVIVLPIKVTAVCDNSLPVIDSSDCIAIYDASRMFPIMIEPASSVVSPATT